MPRYATIITDDDGREVVSAIGEFEGGAPQARLGRVEQVAAGVLIGMVRDGTVDAAGGFGFAEGASGVSGRVAGIVRRKALREAAGLLDKDAAPAKRAKGKRKPSRAKSAKRAKA